ncbi:hypothetical protein VTO42DRAFT_3927 [Malbranchea cinnamomea]
MFHVGASHKCDACLRSNNMHEKRHREIAELIQDIQDIDSKELEAGNQSRSVEEQGCTRNLLTIKRSMMLLLAPPSVHVKVPAKTDTEAMKRFQSCKARREVKQAAKLEKDQRKARRRRQEKINGQRPVSQELIERVGAAIHGPSPSFASVKPGELSIKLLECINLHRSLESQLQKPKTPPKRRGGSKDREPSSKLQLDYVRQVLCKLDVPPRSNCTKERMELVEKAAKAIYQDIELVSKEATETLRRFAAYWKSVWTLGILPFDTHKNPCIKVSRETNQSYRWANKKTYNAMIRQNQIINWETGEKLPEVDVDGEDGMETATPCRS